MWWELCHRCGFTEEEDVEGRATLGGLICSGEAGHVKRSVIHRYRFPEQTHEIDVGDKPHAAAARGKSLRRRHLLTLHRGGSPPAGCS